MYDDLKEEVHDIDNYLAELGREHDLALRDQAMRRDSRNMQLFSFITLVFLPISLVLYAIPAIAVLARWINFTAHPWRSFSLIAGMAAFVVFLLTLMLRFVRRARRLPGA
jgi:Mg2+ and Co2+ transporter CorA